MPRLIILASRSTVKQVTLKGGVTTLGRATTNKVTLHSEQVSRHHAAIEWAGDQFFITDMGSRNGTYVNGIKVRTRALSNGDAIGLGDCQLRFLYSTQAMSHGEALRLLTAPADLARMQTCRQHSGAAAGAHALRLGGPQLSPG